MCGCAGGGLVVGGGLKAEREDSPALAGANMAGAIFVGWVVGDDSLFCKECNK